MKFNIITLLWALNIKSMSGVSIEENGKTYTKRRLLNDSIRFASELLPYSDTTSKQTVQLDFKQKFDPKIAIFAPNCYEEIVATTGANIAGITAVMIKPQILNDEERLIKELNLHQPVAIVVSGKNRNWAFKFSHNPKLNFKLHKIWTIRPNNLVVGFNPYCFTTNILQKGRVGLETISKWF